jgi:hypothetical protein
MLPPVSTGKQRTSSGEVKSSAFIKSGNPTSFETSSDNRRVFDPLHFLGLRAHESAPAVFFLCHESLNLWSSR